MFDNINSKFENEKHTKSFIRIDEHHILDIYIGYNEERYPTMTITEYGNLKSIESSKSISVKLVQHVNGKQSISFSLLDMSLYTIFIRFCSDIIESTKKVDENMALKFIVNRWDSWRMMFKKPSTELLNENQIRGVIGELIFLKDYMIPKFGEKVAIESWMGPDNAHKDFEINDTWYEIKTVSYSSLTVKISSIQQLDSDLIGRLVLIILDKSNAKLHNNINLNEYINKLESSIEDFDAKLMFNKKLLQVGYYYDEEYNNYNYKFISIKNYIVDKKFPKITKSSLNEGIVKLSYEISINSIEKYLGEHI